MDTLGYYLNDDSGVREISDEELLSIVQDIISEADNLQKRGLDRVTSGFIRKKREVGQVDENIVEAHSSHRRKRSTDEINDPKGIEDDDEIPADGEQENTHADSEKEGDFVEEQLEPAVPDNKGISVSDNLRDDDEIDTYELTPNMAKGTDDKRRFDRLSSSFVKKEYGDTNMEKDIADKRRFDRLSSSFVKKDDAGENLDKRRFDRLASSFVKKDKTGEGLDKRRFDRLASSFVKKDKTGEGLDKRRFDRLASSFVKKEYADERLDKRRFDRLASSFVKKDYADEGFNKRRFDRLASSFVKKDHGDEGLDKRRFDRLSSSFVKKDDVGEGVDKRRFDRLASSFVKKDNAHEGLDKRRFDRLSSSFVKKDDVGEGVDKRRLDRLASSFVKREYADEDLDKRRFDRLASPFVKKDNSDNGLDKRRFDRLASSFVKRDYADEGLDKRRFDRLASSFVKKDYTGVAVNDNADQRFNLKGLSGDNIFGTKPIDYPAEKRRIDRVAYGFIKRNDANANFVPILGNAMTDLQKRYFDRLNSGLVKRGDVIDVYPANGQFDGLYSGSVKSPYKGTPFMDKTFYSPAAGLYSNDDDISNTREQYSDKIPIKRKRRSIYTDESGDDYGLGFHAALDDYTNALEKRHFDRLVSGLVKRGLYDVQREHFSQPRHAILSQ